MKSIVSPLLWNDSIDITYPKSEDEAPETLSPPAPFSLNACHVIDTLADLDALIKYLLLEPYFALTLREHSYRSYLGFICVVAVYAEGFCNC